MMDLIRRLHHAIKNNDKNAIQAAVSAGADMDEVWGMQGTALCQAITTGNMDIVALLLDLGCNVNEKDYDGGYPLSLAIRKHQTQMALLLMSIPACDLNALDPVSKERPLCSAVSEGLIDVVEALVQDPRCNITQGNAVGNTALHLALLRKQTNIIRVLSRCEGFRFHHNLAGHAPVHIVGTLGDLNSLDILFPKSSKRSETFHDTVTEGEGKEHDSAGWTGSPHTNTRMLRELDQQAVYTGDTALHLAVREHHTELAHHLIKMGCAVDISNNHGQTALLLACANNYTNLAIRMLKNGAPPNKTGHLRFQEHSVLGTRSRESFLSPLLVSVSMNNMEIVGALCKHGADVNMCDARGRSSLYTALLNGTGDMALYLLNHPAQTLQLGFRDESLLHAVAPCGIQGGQITKILLERGCSINQRNFRGNMPLHEALCWRNAEMVDILLKNGASPHARGELGVMPLTLVARVGHMEIALKLLRAGADVNGADPQGDSSVKDIDENEVDCDEESCPVREALNTDRVDLARYLVEEGADLSTEKYLFREFSAMNLKDRRASYSDDDSSSGSNSSDSEDEEVPWCVQQDKNLFDWLRERACNTRSLMQICLDAVRKEFRRGHLSFESMMHLPLPEKIIAKLLYKSNIHGK